ncbi:MAG: hypothetical protein QM231_07310, partial [Chloroflexota bacterium]|nr:hypothetical protein [Chloroflexota bacterium]
SMLIVILMGTTFVIGSSFLFSSTKLYWNFLFFSIHGLLKRIHKAVCIRREVITQQDMIFVAQVDS